MKQLETNSVRERAAGGRLQAARLDIRGDMKYASKLFVALCLSLCFGAVAANAQIDSDVTVEANVSHPFVVEKTTLPAGKYIIRAADSEGNPSVMEIRSADGHTSVMFDTESAQPSRTPSQSELVFNKLGDTYFLSEVFVKGDNTGAKLSKPRAEERLEGRGMTAERHSVAALAKPFKKVAKKL